ncbi:ABC transporter ATP-binding protein [Longimicrobium sp.]|uniref:ABC transporter ATP-binding protein n=1 Tax=Longimicrobium sp. TaxID=2029185 RepID=UPI003B3B248C
MSIQLSGVHKSFGPKQILRGLDLDVEEGETVSLVGFSGAGKSVTLKHIAGLLMPDRGTVVVDGKEVPKLSRNDLYKMRLDMGYVFQFAALFDSMTIGDNVAMGLRQKGGMSEKEIQSRIAESLGRVGLDGFEKRLPAELSGGQRKRAGLARAIAYRPKYLLYDEPTSGLDPVTTEVIDRLIIRMKEDLGVTSLVITHDMKSAYAISDRIAMLFEGRVVEVGTPDEIKRTENRIVRGFVEGRPEMIEEAEARAAADANAPSSARGPRDAEQQTDGHHAGRAPHRRDA